MFIDIYYHLLPLSCSWARAPFPATVYIESESTRSDRKIRSVQVCGLGLVGQSFGRPQSFRPIPPLVHRRATQSIYSRTTEIIFLSIHSPSSVPSVQFVRPKRVNTRGFVLFPHYESRKAEEIKNQSREMMAVYWDAVHCQVRVVRRVERVEMERSGTTGGRDGVQVGT